jgi:preprotein translocase subunit SecD
MKIPSGAFNLYLWLLLLLTLPACKSTEERKKSKEATTLRLHLETNADGSDRNSGVPIFRANPVMVNVDRAAFLQEGDIQIAEVVDVTGGFAIRIQFNRHGSLVLENVTTSFKGRRYAIQAQFGDSRWLAAPVISRRIADGSIVFTPDATREEAERIVRGLNNVARAVQKL